MNKLQFARALIVDIQQFLAVGVLPKELTDESLARAYAELCEKAHVRLGQCNTLLDQGQYTESIRLEREPPSLLDLIDVLSFPQLGRWLAHVRDHNLETPRMLNDMQVARINEAYVRVENSAEFEVNLRRSAMLRPPDLYGCILALRRLTSIQPDVAFWKEDLIVFEKRRLDQIAEEFRKTMADRDLSQAFSLMSELSADWQAQETFARIADMVKKGLTELQEEVALQQAERVVGSLHAARTANQFSEVGIYLEQYRHIHSAGYLNPTAEMVETVSGIDNWYKDESDIRIRSEEMKQFIEKLRSHVNDPDVSSLKEMLRLRNLVFGTNLDELKDVTLPDEMPASKVNSVIRYLEKVARVRTITIAGCSVIALVAITLTGLFVYRQRSVNHLTTYYGGALRAAEDARDAKRFETLADELEKTPLVKNLRLVPELQAILNKKDSLVILVQKAQQEFTLRLETLGRIAEAVYDKDDEFLRLFSEADKLRLHYPLLRDDPQCEASLAECRAARQSFWESRLLEAEQQLQGLSDKLQEESDNFGKLVFAPQPDKDRVSKEIQAVLSQAAQVKKSVPGILAKNVSSPTLQTTQTRFDDLEKKVAELMHLSRACAQRRVEIESSRTLANYFMAIETYAKEYPDDATTLAIRDVLGTRQQYDQFSAWSGIVLDDKDMEELFKKAAGIPAENIYWSPLLIRYIEPFKRSLEVWGKVTDAVYKGQQSWKSDAQLTQLHTLLYRTNERTVVTCVVQGEKREAGIAGNLKFYEFDAYAPEEKDDSENFKVIRVRADQIVSLEPMSHCVYVNRLIQKIKDTPESRAPDFLLETIHDLRDTDQITMDLLRYRMIIYFAERAAEVYGPGKLPVLERIIASRDKLDANALRWICMRNKEVIKANEDARRFLASQLGGVDLKAKLRRESDIAKTCISRGARWVGFVSPVNGLPILAREIPGEVWLLRTDASGMLVPVIASEDGKQFGVALKPGECLFSPAVHETASTRKLRFAIGQNTGSPLTDAELPPVWPREIAQVANKDVNP